MSKKNNSEAGNYEVTLMELRQDIKYMKEGIDKIDATNQKQHEDIVHMFKEYIDTMKQNLETKADKSSVDELKQDFKKTIIYILLVAIAVIGFFIREYILHSGG